MGNLNFNFRKITLLLAATFLIAATYNSGAFALLGPVQPWMQSTNGVINAGDIGGPMLLTNEYRWNVPVVTYGFDKSFTDYFGSNGVAAVESAIQILNNLPPASQIVLTNYPFRSQSFNPTAQANYIQDLKSSALALIVWHLGLAHPVKNIYVMRQWNSVLIPPPNQFLYQFYWPDWIYPDFISILNYDPQTLNSTAFVDDILYSAYVVQYGNQNYLQPFPVDPSSPLAYSSVADFDLQLGGYYTGLTYDDVGGLSYLLSANNVNYETLIPGVVSASTNANLFVNGAWRPGVEKITFLPHLKNLISGVFMPTTNYFTDTFYSNGVAKQQSLARIVSQPDFLFSAGDAHATYSSFFALTQSGTTNWMNNAAANGNPAGAGPGVIQPPTTITFDKFGAQFITYGYYSDEHALSYAEDSIFPILPSWGSFAGTTNLPVAYPIPQSGTNQMTLRLSLELGVPPNQFWKDFEYKTSTLIGGRFVLQTSANMMEWVTLFTVTNNGTIPTYLVRYPKSQSRFYRLNPQ